LRLAKCSHIVPNQPTPQDDAQKERPKPKNS
jgi:hypothetical protein